MSGLEVATYMAWILAGCAIAVGVAMIPAYLLVITERFAGRTGLFAAAATLCAALTWLYLNWVYEDPDWESYGNFFAWAALSFGSMAASIVAGIGRPETFRQTMAAGSAAVLVPGTLVLLGLAVFARGEEQWMAVGGVALAAYLVFRHWQTRRKAAVKHV